MGPIIPRPGEGVHNYAPNAGFRPIFAFGAYLGGPVASK